MSFCGSVVRSIRVSGSCGAWFPVVLESMRSNGLCDVSGVLPAALWGLFWRLRDRCPCAVRY